MTGFSRIFTDFHGFLRSFRVFFADFHVWKILKIPPPMKIDLVGHVERIFAIFLNEITKMTIEMRIDCPVQFFINFGCVVARWDMAYFQKFLR